MGEKIENFVPQGGGGQIFGLFKRMYFMNGPKSKKKKLISNYNETYRKLKKW